MWKQSFKEAKENLTIADHLFYVTFKHSKNVDILKAVIDKLVDALQKLISSVVELKYEEGVLKVFSKNPKVQLDLFMELLKEKEPIEELNPEEFLDFYLFLRKLKRAKYSGIDNFKRTVKIKFDIDIGLVMHPKEIQDLLEKTKKYFKIIEKYLE